jgi:hypothetical protein
MDARAFAPPDHLPQQVPARLGDKAQRPGRNA